jgi:hypothetical protein
VSDQQQEDFLKENDFIRVHFLLTPIHDSLLKKIDPDNKSRALRIVLDNYIKSKRLIKFEKYLMSLSFGMILLGVGTILPNIYISTVSMILGAFIILFSLYMYLTGKIKYEVED